MLLSEVKGLTQGWLDHAAATDQEFQNSTIQEFHRFFFYFVPFNAQYTAIARYLKTCKKTKLKLFKGDNVRDSASATEGVQEFLTGLDPEQKHLALFDNVVVSRGREEGQNAVSTLATLIKDTYNIHVRYDGTVKHDKDDELVVMLKSEDRAQRVEGVLTVMYQVRCNMFHGQKRLMATQEDLLIPINDLLKVLTEKLQLEFDNLDSESI